MLLSSLEKSTVLSTLLHLPQFPKLITLIIFYSCVNFLAKFLLCSECHNNWLLRQQLPGIYVARNKRSKDLRNSMTSNVKMAWRGIGTQLTDLLGWSLTSGGITNPWGHWGSLNGLWRSVVTKFQIPIMRGGVTNVPPKPPPPIPNTVQSLVGSTLFVILAWMTWPLGLHPFVHCQGCQALDDNWLRSREAEVAGNHYFHHFIYMLCLDL